MRLSMQVALGFVVIAAGLFGAWLWSTDYFGKREVEDLVRAQLKDPESARFARLRTEGGGLTGCGYVNAKNSLGGYVGDKQFMVWDEAVSFAPEDDRGNFGTCCNVMLLATRERIDAPSLDEFPACAGLVEPFRW